ncbi:hypothetical protein CC86DRAFT_401744 [Ophiobolus disseminans]|uniref:DUF7730 domain-containing protein n=1 Tax=Ophiobolus disseminans TaxID=1469910 RepID=A0A6A7AEV8_9PLEO|nr:hypothetical protein CC86DRAFT_401744 [Ophiobolus disseminans]
MVEESSAQANTTESAAPQLPYTMEKPRGSPLLQLPAELRNAIYKHVLGNEAYLLGRCPDTKGPLVVIHSLLNTPSPRPYTALLRVNRQIRTEASLLLYSHNTFQLFAMAPLQAFIDHRTPKQLQARYQAGIMDRPGGSPLLKLPPELRNQIWEQVLGGITYHIRMAHDNTRAYSMHSYPSLNIGLLLVSHQVHAEVSLLLYSSSTFSFLTMIALETFVTQRTVKQHGALKVLQFGTIDGEDFLGLRCPHGELDLSVLDRLHNLTRIQLTSSPLLYGRSPDIKKGLVELARVIRLKKPGMKITGRENRFSKYIGLFGEDFGEL